MEAISPMSMFLAACGGGVLAEAVKWYQLRESPVLPDYAKGWVYWIITIVMILAGGGLAVAYGGDIKTHIQAINIGASAPLIIKALFSAAQAEDARKGFAPITPRASISRFLAGK